MVITHAYIEPVVGKTIADGYLRFGAAIEEMGPMEQYVPKAGEEVLDAGGKWLLPGFVDIHTHLGLFGDGVGFEAEDCNESTDPITPQLRVIDGINPMDRTFEEARNGGVTAVIVAPGSANPIAGQAAAIRTYGRRIDDMILKAPVAMKFALGENPKSTYNDRDETPVTRMATAALIRENLRKAQEYRMKQQLAQEDPDFDAPDFDMKLEALVPVLNREIQAHFHAHRLDDIFTAIRIAKEFDLDYVIIHGTEAYLAPDIMAPGAGPGGNRPESAGSLQAGAAEHELFRAGGADPPWRSVLHLHRPSGNASAISAPLRGHGYALGFDAAGGIGGHYHPTCQNCGTGQANRQPGSWKRRGSGAGHRRPAGAGDPDRRGLFFGKEVCLR